MKKRKKSLTGWTSKDWRLEWEKKVKNRSPEYIDTIPAISNNSMLNPSAPWEVKVRITIEEL